MEKLAKVDKKFAKWQLKLPKIVGLGKLWGFRLTVFSFFSNNP